MSHIPPVARNADSYTIAERLNVVIKELNNDFQEQIDALDVRVDALEDDARTLQIVSTQTGAVATGTTTVPQDDTIPQNTEGDQYMSLSITPKNAASTLIIDVVWNGASSVLNNLVAALFQDTTANALAVGPMTHSANFLVNIAFRHVMTSGTTSATTFKVRVGGNAAGTTTFNGVGAGRLYGGVVASSIVIREVLL